MLSENGAPTPVAATRLRAPQSLMGPIEAAALDRAVKSSPLWPRYAEPVDRESAYEKISAEQAAAEARAEAAAAAAADEKQAKATEKQAKEAEKEAARAARGAPEPEPSLAEQVVGSGLFRSLARSIGTQLGREISRSVFGTARRRR